MYKRSCVARADGLIAGSDVALGVDVALGAIVVTIGVMISAVIVVLFVAAECAVMIAVAGSVRSYVVAR